MVIPGFLLRNGKNTDKFDLLYHSSLPPLEANVEATLVHKIFMCTYFVVVQSLFCFECTGTEITLILSDITMNSILM